MNVQILMCNTAFTLLIMWTCCSAIAMGCTLYSTKTRYAANVGDSLTVNCNAGCVTCPSKIYPSALSSSKKKNRNVKIYLKDGTKILAEWVNGTQSESEGTIIVSGWTTFINEERSCEVKNLTYTIRKLTEDHFKLNLSCIATVSGMTTGKVSASIALDRDTTEEAKKNIEKAEVIVEEARKYKESSQALLIAGSIVIIMMFMILLFIWKYNLDIRILLKDKFYSEDIDGVYDLYICYDPSEEGEFVSKCILPTLEDKLGYKCFVLERDAEPGAWLPDVIFAKLKHSKRFLLFMSEGVKQNEICRFACERAMEEALGPRNLKLICVAPKTFWKNQNAVTENAYNFILLTRREPLEVICKKFLSITKFDAQKSTKNERNKFWKKLRLKLPPQQIAGNRSLLGLPKRKPGNPIQFVNV